MTLSLRLSRLATFYHQAPSIWDIGCDHGLLGLSFLDRESVQCIHLVDPSLPVIEELKKKPIDSHIPKGGLLKIHHQKGQEITLEKGISKCLFIAGMGGKEIKEIVENLVPQMSKADRLIISPHRKILELRAYLAQSELGLLREETVLEDEQFYQVLCLIKDPSLPRTSLYGEGIWKGPDGLRYLEHQIQHFSRHMDEVSRAYLAYLKSLSN